MVSSLFPISTISKLNIYQFINITKFLRVLERYSNFDCYNYVDTNIYYIYMQNGIKENTLQSVWNIFDIIIPIWAFISIALLIKVIFTYFHTNYITGKTEIKDKRIYKIFEECKTKLKIKRKIKLINQNYFSTPAIIGIFDVRILLTDKIMSLDDKSLKCIFMHELSHYKRKDNILNLIIEFLKTIHFFNPVLYKSFRRMKKDMEIATDELATQKMDFEEKKKYCSIMVYISQISNKKLELALGMADDTKILEERINMISETEKLKKHSKLLSIFTVVILLFVWIVFYPNSFGNTDIPEIAIRINNDEIIELEPGFDNYENIQIIKINDFSQITVIIKDGKYKKYINYSKEEFKNLENNTDIVNGSIKKLEDNVYKIVFNEENANQREYLIKFVIE